MAASSSAESSAFPSSPYAAELYRGLGSRPFSPPIEAEYARSQLLAGRTLIRVATVLALVLAIRHAGEQLLGLSQGAPHSAVAWAFLAASVTMAAIAWSPLFERLYLAVATRLVPLKNAVAALSVASMAAAGQLEALMAVPLLVLGPFFFLGLPYRTALFTVLLSIASFTVSAAIFELAVATVLRACALALMTTVACAVAARHLEKGSRRSFLERRLIAELAENDPLTGLKNRRVLDEQMERLWQQAAANGRTIAILLADVDHFKAYNDRYGHQAGDRALRQVAQALQQLMTRPLDVLVRYGGEEFAAILYDIAHDEAAALAERMRRAVSELAIEHRECRELATLTVSIGVAVVDPSRERRSRGGLQLADQSLYEAKVGGRDRVAIKDQVAHGMLVTGVFARSTAVPRA